MPLTQAASKAELEARKALDENVHAAAVRLCACPDTAKNRSLRLELKSNWERAKWVRAMVLEAFAVRDLEEAQSA